MPGMMRGKKKMMRGGSVKTGAKKKKPGKVMIDMSTKLTI